MVVKNPDRVSTPVPVPFVGRSFHRFTLDECRRLIEIGVLNGDDRCELVNGYLLERPPVNPPHASATRSLTKRMSRIVGEEWVTILGQPVELPTSASMLLPDLALAFGPDSSYEDRHPTAKELTLVVEISDSSLGGDRTTKLEIYARDKIPVYWIVNLIDRQVEVYAQPRGGKKPTYRTRADYAAGSSVPVVLNGIEVGSIAVDEILPKSE